MKRSIKREKGRQTDRRREGERERDEEKVKYIKIASPLNIAEDGRGRSPLLMVAAGERERDCRWMRR